VAFGDASAMADRLGCGLWIDPLGFGLVLGTVPTLEHDIRRKAGASSATIATAAVAARIGGGDHRRPPTRGTPEVRAAVSTSLLDCFVPRCTS
jgi:hypothetical protein